MISSRAMNDRIVWIGAIVVVASASVVYYAHRSGCVPERDSYEGAPVLGGSGSPRGHIPPGWQRPPPIGSDPDYMGPEPTAPMRFSPYAMSTSKRVRRRRLPRDNGDPAMAEAVLHVMQGVEGRVGYLGNDPGDRFEDLGDRMRDVDDRLFAGNDPSPIAERLLGEGFSWLLVSSREPVPVPWMATDVDGLRIRLRDALPLSHFHPVIFSRSHVLYRIAPPMELAQSDMQRITEWVRDRLADEAAPPLGIERSTASVGRNEHRAIISLRARRHSRVIGRRVVSASESGSTLEEALAHTVERIQRDWDEARAEAIDRFRVTFDRDLSEAIGEMELEVEIVDRMCHIIDRDVGRLLWQFELGIEGMYFERGERFSYMSPATPIQRASGDNFRGERGMLDKFLEWNALQQDDWLEPGRPGTARGRYASDFGRFETHHWLERGPGGEIVVLYRNVPLVTIADVSRDNLIRSLRLGAMWLVNNQLDDGQFRYRYKPLEENNRRRWIRGNNIVRHALNPYTLLLVNRVAPDERLVESARRGLAYTIEHIRHEREGERCYVWHQDVPAPYENAKMGTVAVTILSILAMADAMDISEYEEILICLANELVYVQDRNGHFRQYDVPDEHEYYGCENSIFPGEMQLALARVYTHTGDERYRQAFSRAFDFYRQWWAANVSRRTRDGVYNEEDRMNLVGFVPWNVMALNEMHRQTGEQHYADFAFELQNWMDDTFFFDPERTSYPDYMGSYYKHHAELPAINSSGYTEGAAAAYDLALRTGRDVERRRRTLIHGVRFAMQIQYEGYATSYYVPNPRTAMGGFRYNLNFSRSRNDYSYHAMSALAQAVAFLRAQDYPAVNPVLLPPTLQLAQGTAEEIPAEEEDDGAEEIPDAGPPSPDGEPPAPDGGGAEAAVSPAVEPSSEAAP